MRTPRWQKNASLGLGPQLARGKFNNGQEKFPKRNAWQGMSPPPQPKT